jgi:hypothetical protein
MSCLQRSGHPAALLAEYLLLLLLSMASLLNLLVSLALQLFLLLLCRLHAQLLQQCLPQLLPHGLHGLMRRGHCPCRLRLHLPAHWVIPQQKQQPVLPPNHWSCQKHQTHQTRHHLQLHCRLTPQQVLRPAAAASLPSC